MQGSRSAKEILPGGVSVRKSRPSLVSGALNLLSVSARDKPICEGQCLHCSHLQLQDSQAGDLYFWGWKSRPRSPPTGLRILSAVEGGFDSSCTPGCGRTSGSPRSPLSLQSCWSALLPKQELPRASNLQRLESLSHARQVLHHSFLTFLARKVILYSRELLEGPVQAGKIPQV